MATEASLWPAQLYGTVYQQQFVKPTACIRFSSSSKNIILFNLYFNDWLSVSLHFTNFCNAFCAHRV